MSKIRVLRGTIEAYQTQGHVQLIQNDQRFTHGYKIKKFMISYSQLYSSTAATRDCYGVLATHPDALESAAFPTLAVEWNWQDKRQVAWAAMDILGDSSVGFTFELIDPTHIIVRDLYVGITPQGFVLGDKFNYYIELEEIELSENQAVLAIVQEEAQDAGSAS